MKILQVVQSLAKAGAERLVVSICNELAKDSQNEVVVFMGAKDVNAFSTVLDKRIRIVFGGTEFNFSLFRKNGVINKSYIALIKEFQPDIIHSHLYFADLISHSYITQKTAYVSHLHNSEIEEHNGFVLANVAKKKMWTNLNEYLWLRKKYKKHKTNFIACSKGALLLHKNKIGLGETLLLPNASPLPELNYEFKQLNGTLQLVWIGRFTKVKRPHLAIEIAKLLKDNKVDFHLKMAGNGAEMAVTKRAIRENKLENEVTLLGVIDDVSDFYLNADLMIHTSVYEGLPLVFTESLSYGVPIFTTDCMPDNEIIEDGVNGKMIHSENPIDFKNAIVEILSKPDVYSELSKNAIDTAKKFSIEVYVEKLVKFYKKILTK